MDQKLRKEERLCLKKQFDSLIQHGSGFFHYPYKVIWQCQPHDAMLFPVQIAITVPKKRFKKAHDRNLIRRRTREAYRLNKNLLYKPLHEHNMNIALLLVYVADEIHDYKRIQDSVIQVIRKLIKNSNA